MKEIRAFLAPGLAEVETLIGTSLRSDVALLDQTNRNLRENPGKMLRPMLALLSAGAVGKVNDSTRRYAAATELLHNATLLHDDVVDGATERRGLPTVASLLNPPAAVLIGDYWLVKCLQLVLSAQVEPHRVLTRFSQTLGHLTEGELLQMQLAATGATTEEDYLRILYGKTASLFELAATAAAISVQAPEEQVQALGRFARLLGYAFQIKDDLLDYSASEAVLGKPVGIDLLEQKITLPLLCALEQVPAAEAQAVREQVTRLADHPQEVAEVRAFVLAHDGPALAARRMDGFVQEALACLETLPQTQEKAFLTRLAAFVAQREQ